MFFPHEDGRTWDYVNTDPAVSSVLHATLEDSEEREGVAVHTVAYQLTCPADAKCDLREPHWIEWSSTPGRGVQIHGAGDPPTRFDPPVQIADPQTRAGERVRTETDNGTWVSTFDGVGECHRDSVLEKLECTRFRLTNADGNVKDLPLAEVAAAIGHGPVVLSFANEPGQWVLTSYDCGACDGVW